MGESWWSRVDGSLDVGFNFTKANDARQWSLSGEANRRGERFGTSLDFSSLFTSQEGIENTSRQVLTWLVDRYLPRRWVVSLIGQFQQNEELGLNARGVIGGGAGRYLVQTNRTILAVLGGVSFTRERFQGGEPGASSVEALTIVDLQAFKFDDPQTDIGAARMVTPSRTDAGRVRIDLDTHVRREILKGSYWNISVFDNYDSAPSAAGAESNNYGFISSFGSNS